MYGVMLHGMYSVFVCLARLVLFVCVFVCLGVRCSNVFACVVCIFGGRCCMDCCLWFEGVCVCLCVFVCSCVCMVCLRLIV